MLLMLRLSFAYMKYMLFGPADLLLENAALRQQLAVYERNAKRPRLKRRDRVFWVWLSWCWKDWRSALVIVQPATVIGWHRAGFRIYWRFKSRPSGRPKVEAEVRHLIGRMSRENPLWGAPRIQAELRLLGHQLAESSVAKYMIRQGSHRPPSPSWKNVYCERDIGSIRRECLDHVIAIGEAHLKRLLADYVLYYNEHRTHQSLCGDAPDGREVESIEGDIVAIPIIGGLHHRYTRVAA